MAGLGLKRFRTGYSGSVGGLIASTPWFRGVGRLPVGASAPLVLLSPLVAAVIGVALGGSLSPLQPFGFALARAALPAAQLSAPKLSGRVTHGGPAEARSEETAVHDDRTRAGPTR